MLLSSAKGVNDWGNPAHPYLSSRLPDNIAPARLTFQHLQNRLGMKKRQQTDSAGFFMKVTYYHRRPLRGQFSVERVFSEIRKALPEGIDCRIATCRYSRGSFGRLCNILEAIYHQGDINHITGDVYYIASLLRKRKTVLTVHDCVSLHRLSGWKRALFKYLWYDLPVARSRMVVAISQFIADELVTLVPAAAGKIRVIYDPVGWDFQYNSKAFNAERPRILHLGSTPNKNLPRLIQALSGIPCHLEIIGDLPGEIPALLRRQKIQYSCASNLTDAEIEQKYRDCDMVAFISTYEGFGMPIAEANAMGRVVVTSNTGSMREIAADAACLVDPLDVQSIRNGIMQIIGDEKKREALIQRGLENAKRFRPEIIASQYAALYKEMVTS
jgi:glycosyltransferase involved in cell wall biosynthesis